MVIHSLLVGGAENFFVRFARALSARHHVTVFIPCKAMSAPHLLAQLGDLPVQSIPGFNAPGYRLFYKLTTLLQRLTPRFNPELMLNVMTLRRMNRRMSFDVVNPHLLAATQMTCRAFGDVTHLVIAESDHGDYAWMDARRRTEYAAIFNREDALICPAQENVKRAQQFPWHKQWQALHIPYGYEKPRVSQPLERGDAFTFGMVARGVEEKGWGEALAAFRLARQRCPQPLKLILVGAGPCLDELRNTLADEDRNSIEFTGMQADPSPWIERFDAGLLPSFFAAESLPNTIIEYLAHNKPVIATAIGGIPEMLTTAQGPAGLLIEQTSAGPASISALADAMVRLVETPHEYAALQSCTALAFERFSMARCVAAYEQAFHQLLARRV